MKYFNKQLELYSRMSDVCHKYNVKTDKKYTKFTSTN